MWSDWHRLGTIASPTCRGFGVRLKLWGGGRRPDNQVAAADMARLDIARAVPVGPGTTGRWANVVVGAARDSVAGQARTTRGVHQARTTRGAHQARTTRGAHKAREAHAAVGTPSGRPHVGHRAAKRSVSR
jgi:hypothetical protein